MKKKYFIFILTAAIVGLCGCDPLTEQIPVGISVTDPFESKDPMVQAEKDGFVLYLDGTNNYMDDMFGYLQADHVPEEFDRYEVMLNHSGEYNDPRIQDFSSDCIDYDFISAYQHAKEGSYKLLNYSVSTLMPEELTEDNTFYEHGTVDEEQGEKRVYSFAVGKDSVFYNSVNTLGNVVNHDEFVKYFTEPSMGKWKFFLSDLFTLPENAEPVFDSDDLYLTMSCDCALKITYFEEPYCGKLKISVDRTDGSFICTFLGYRESVLSGEPENAYSRKQLLEAFLSRYRIEKAGSPA